MIISKNIRVRYPDVFKTAEYSIVDDFCYFSTQIDIGYCSHISNNCTVAGGRELLFKIGKYGSLAAGVRIFCASDDFVNDVAVLFPNGLNYLKTHTITGDVIMGDYVTIGANTVVMPHQNIPDGVTVGAMSFVPAGFKFEPWSVYAGSPKLRLITRRNKANVLLEVAKLEEYL